MLLFVLQKLTPHVAWHDDGHHVQICATFVVNNADLKTSNVGDRSSDSDPFNPFKISSAESPCTVACISISAILPWLLMLLIPEGSSAGEYVEEECKRPLRLSRLHAAHL